MKFKIDCEVSLKFGFDPKQTKINLQKCKHVIFPMTQEQTLFVVNFIGRRMTHFSEVKYEVAIYNGGSGKEILCDKVSRNIRLSLILTLPLCI